MTITATNDASAGALFQSSVQAAGIDVSHLGQLAQIQLAVASLLGSGADLTSPLTLGMNGAAFVVQGTAVPGVADMASGAITFKANTGTGTGAVGGIIFQVPVTHSSDSVAQTLTTVLTLSATTTVAATFAGALTVTTTTISNGALTVNAASQLGTASGTDVTTIGGTGYGAGVASLRLNGLTTAATNNLVGTLTNSPVTGNPTFWAPISIAGVVKYFPCF